MNEISRKASRILRSLFHLMKRNSIKYHLNREEKCRKGYNE